MAYYEPQWRLYENLKDNDGKPRMDYVERLREMSDEALREETERKIWLSAFANNNPRSDYHWHVDACYDVLMVRTGSDAAYAEYYERVKQSL